MRGIVKDFPGQRALDRADFFLRHGEIHALVGHNGAGKSTLIKVLAGLYPKDGGEIWLDGQKVEIHNPSQAMSLGLSFIHQELGLVPAFNAIENLMLGLPYPRTRLGFIDWAATAKNAEQIAKKMRLSFDLRKPVKELSISEQWLISIGRALMRESKILVLDEPTSALTRDEVEKLFQTLRRLKESGASIIYISHRLQEIFELADAVTVMKDGKVVGTKSVKEVDEETVISMMIGKPVSNLKVKPKARDRGEVIFSVRNLSRQGVVENISFDLYANEVLGIAGLVGAKRTEIFRLIFGADKKDSGELFIRGQPVSINSPTEAISHGLAMIPEDRRSEGLIQNMPLAMNITLPHLPICRLFPSLSLMSPRKEKNIAKRFIADLQIRTTGPNQQVKFLSGGNQQKVVLSKWLCKKAQVFIFDEPTTGIDVETKEEIYKLMRSLADEGAGVIFISSDFSELVRASDRTLVIREGKVVAELPKEQISEEQLLYYCYAQEAAASL